LSKDVVVARNKNYDSAHAAAEISSGDIGPVRKPSMCRALSDRRWTSLILTQEHLVVLIDDEVVAFEGLILRPVE
jgi:hypothetical protein